MEERWWKGEKRLGPGEVRLKGKRGGGSIGHRQVCAGQMHHLLRCGPMLACAGCITL